MGLELARAMVMVRADTSQLPSDLESAKSAVSAGLAGIHGAMAGVLGGISALGAGFIRSGIASAASFEQTQIAFETMLGSAAETEKTLAALTSFAAKTPFEMPEILQAARGLIQFGERGDELMNTLKFLGDASAGTSSRFGDIALIFNQVRGVGKLLTQDFRQLSTRGVISLQDIAKHYGKTTEEAQKMLSTGKISFKDFANVLEGVSKEGGRFANMMEKQSGSLLGLKSTLNDAIGILGRFVATPIAEMFKPLVKFAIIATDAVSALVQKFPGLASNILSAITVVSGLGASLYGASSVLRFFGIDAARVWSILKTGGIVLLAGAAKFLLIGAAIGAAISAIQQVVKWILNLKPVQDSIAKASAKFAEAWVHIKAAFDNVGASIYGVLQSIFSQLVGLFGMDVSSLSDSIGSAISSAIDWIANFVVKAATLLRVMTENWGAVWSIIKAATNVAFLYIWDIVSAILSNIGKIIMSLPNIAMAAFNSMVSIAAHAIAAIGDAFPHLVTIVSATFQSLLAGLMGYVQASNTAWAGVFNVMLKVFEKLPVIAAGAIDAVVFGFNALVEHLTNFPALLQEALTGGDVAGMLGRMTADIGAKMKEGFMQYGHMEYIAETAKEAVGNTLAEVNKIPGAMSTAFTEAGGSTAITNLGDTLTSNFQETIDALSRQWEGVMPELSDLGISSETMNKINDLRGQVSGLLGLMPREEEKRGTPLVPGGVGRVPEAAPAAAGKGVGERFGLAEYGQRLQETLMKGDVAKASLTELMKHTMELKEIKKGVFAAKPRDLSVLTDENPGAIQGGFGFGV